MDRCREAQGCARTVILRIDDWIKWYLPNDSLTRHRTDSSLARLMTPILPNVKEIIAENRLNEFLSKINPMSDIFSLI